MPYIGRNHITGDHTSNFKVLDDISSYTATFDGSSSNVVSTTNETLRIIEHRFLQGQRVTYSNGGGGNIGGLTNGTAYFVTRDTANTIKLATSLANANNNTNINLSSVGSGSSHTLTAAFDGINKEFKATHNGGTSVHIANTTQLQIAINNVIQKPNDDSSYTEGFRVVNGRKIQFKTAPTSSDVFWGNIIANTIETFDISDLKIDNFTGDGSTTQYTLSRDVPNNQSIMVTLDGVTQHPSDNDNSRAYALVTDSIIQFTSPPGLGVEIQIRHLGFAGAATGEVSGFYGRTGNVVLGSSDDIIVRSVNSSGVVTATSFNSGATLIDGSGNIKKGTSTPAAFTTTSPDQHFFFGKHCMQGCITDTKTLNGSGAGTFDLGKLWLVDDTSIELFITISRTAALGFTTTYCKAFIMKVRGTGMHSSHILYQAQSGASAPIISSISAGGWTGGNAGQLPHGTQVNVTSGDNNGAYRLVCHYTAISKNEMY